MSKGDDYRKRADALNKPIRHRNAQDARAPQKKQKALRAMADNEDWLDGKPAPKKPKAT